MDLLEAANARGMTLILVTHDAELSSRARRVIRMVDGVANEVSNMVSAMDAAGMSQ
jgi:predicted ABC-type transport system involved in lysophospholipase L1 biosynthesis ATPase subunit